MGTKLYKLRFNWLIKSLKYSWLILLTFLINNSVGVNLEPSGNNISLS